MYLSFFSLLQRGRVITCMCSYSSFQSALPVENHMLIEAAENAIVIKGLPMLSLTLLDYFYLLRMKNNF